jgi:hypothetical protein
VSSVASAPDDVALKLEAVAAEVYRRFFDLVGRAAQAGLEHSLHVHLGGAAGRSPSSDGFIQALLNDPTLGSAFEFRGDDPTERIGVIYALTVMSPRYLTSGSSLFGQAAIFPGQLILMAAYQCLAADDLTQQRFVSEAVRALDEVRSLLAGEAVDVPFYVGLSGLTLATGVELPTPWGTIRPLRSSEEHLFFTGPPDARVVLQGSVEIKVMPEEKIGRGYPAQDAVSLMTRKAVLALTFGVDRDPPVGISTSWSLIFSHLNGSMSVPGLRSGLVAPCELSAADTAEVLRVSPVIEERYCGEIDLSVRRYLSALGNRSDPVDGLIDAMISLESLTQQDISGVTFQLAASVAVLLGDTITEREAIFRRMKALYGKRSRVVHGSASLPPTELVEAALETANLVLRCLRKLFFERPELLRSEQRGRDIVLGASLLE